MWLTRDQEIGPDSHKTLAFHSLKLRDGAVSKACLHKGHIRCDKIPEEQVHVAGLCLTESLKFDGCVPEKVLRQQKATCVEESRFALISIDQSTPSRDWPDGKNQKAAQCTSCGLQPGFLHLCRNPRLSPGCDKYSRDLGCLEITKFTTPRSFDLFLDVSDSLKSFIPDLVHCWYSLPLALHSPVALSRDSPDDLVDNLGISQTKLGPGLH